MKKKSTKGIIIIIFLLLFFVVGKFVLILGQYKKIEDSGEYKNWSMTQRPLYNENHKVEFMIDETKKVELNLWWESLTGNIEVRITDKRGTLYFNKKASQMKEKDSITLNEGEYKLEINASNFTGAVALGYNNIIEIKELPNDNYNIISSDPSKGFMSEYILYIPSKVKVNKLLVIPNNTGGVSDNIEVHKEAAKGLIIDKSKLAEELGVPLLIPIFPRPRSHDELYTHALDRKVLLTNINDLKRLDLQLIAMIDDSREILFEKGIKADEKVLMSGFSASGDFVDRFTFLHPEIVIAAVIGGSDNIIPYSNINGQDIPYPIGIYDYKEMTGNAFDINLINEVYRYIFKGSEDEGGWQNCEEDGKTTRYTGKEYYQRFEMPQIIESTKQRNTLIDAHGDLTDMEQKEILYKAYDGKILLDKFLAVKSIFKELKLDKSEFVVYEGLGHEITDKIQQDELEFFNKVLKNE